MNLFFNNNYHSHYILHFSMSATPVCVPSQIDIAIVGAGPHALTLVTHLLQKCKQLSHRFLVFDPSGT